MFAAIRPRVGAVSSAAGRSRRTSAASRPAAATGAWTTKIARQSNAWVSTPPSAGPSAPPITLAPAQSAGRPTSGSAPTRRSAAPAPCTVRAATSSQIPGATAHASDATRKIAVPASTSRFAPARGAKRTSTSATTASARLYEVTTHATSVIETSNCPSRSGSASTTIDESANAIATVARSAPTASRRSQVTDIAGHGSSDRLASLRAGGRGAAGTCRPGRAGRGRRTRPSGRAP